MDCQALDHVRQISMVTCTAQTSSLAAPSRLHIGKYLWITHLTPALTPSSQRLIEAVVAQALEAALKIVQ
jgi:hypothetical protein